MSDRSAVYEFGAYRLDPRARVLSLRDRPIALAPKSFDLLLLLVERRGRVLERDELFRELWPDTVVEEANLTFQVSTLRKALGEDGSKWIETVPKHGYRFSAPVRELRPEENAAAEAPPAAAKSPARRAWPLVGAVLALAIALLAFALLRRQAPVEPPGAPRGPIAVPLTAYPGSEIHPTLSPDGSQVAFSWEGSRQDNVDIYLKLVGPGDPRRLTTDPAADFSPAWSPDGRQIAFLRGGDGLVVRGPLFRTSAEGNRCGIYLIPALGGAERRLGEIDLTAFRTAAGRLAWTPDGRWLAAAGRFADGDPSEIWLFSPETGERRRLTVAGDAQIGDFGLSFSPDGRFLALLRFATRSVGDVYLLPLGAGYVAGGPLVRLTHENMLVGGPCWNSRADRIFYSSGGALGYRTLRMLAIDPAHPARRVEPVPLPAGEQATTLASARDRLVYAREQRDTNIWRLPLPASAPGRAPTLLIASTFDEHNPDFSADGTRITFTSTRSGTEEIWVANADGSEPTQMTSFGGPNTSNSRWSRDGRTVLFNSRRSGSSDLYVLDVATRSIQRLTDDPSDEYEPRWSRDGNWIYYVSTRSGSPEVWKIPSGGRAAVQVTRQGGLAAFESADGRWLYYAKDLARPTSIWRVPVDGGEETKVLDGLSYSFNFAVTDKGIYLLALRGAPSVASIEFFDLATGKTTLLHTLDRPFWFGFALAPDERAILFSKIDSHGSDLMLVENLR
jgi:Tol biopolymer transport system component/DNA-binding winged helix-turn-helix (wHTH) protein